MKPDGGFRRGVRWAFLPVRMIYGKKKTGKSARLTVHRKQVQCWLPAMLWQRRRNLAVIIEL